MSLSSSGAVNSPEGMRVFLGVKIAADISDQLAGLAKELRGENVRLVAPGDIHLTLVPPWNEMSCSDAIEKTRLTVSMFNPFELELQHLSYGPELKRPRLLWVECAASYQITSLRDALLHLFKQKDQRPFLPHITLARLRGNGAATARRHPIGGELFFSQRVNSIELFRSPPPGATGYQILASSPLTA